MVACAYDSSGVNPPLSSFNNFDREAGQLGLIPTRPVSQLGLGSTRPGQLGLLFFLLQEGYFISI